MDDEDRVVVCGADVRYFNISKQTEAEKWVEISVIGQETFARLEIVPEIQCQSGALDIRKRPLIWLSVCCLDAPFVAIAWQWLFADVFSVPLPAANTVALFLPLGLFI